MIGIASAEHWTREGLAVAALKDRFIYPMYGVWAPTSQRYLELLAAYLRELKQPERVRTVADLGSGTGVLSVLVGESGVRGQIVCIDSSARAVECRRLNAQIFGVEVLPRQLDPVAAYLQEHLFYGDSEAAYREGADLEFFQAKRRAAAALQIPSKYDLIVCNPPLRIFS